MSEFTNDSPEPHLKRVTLPSGKSIEVVRFGDENAEQPQTIRQDSALHVCGDCDSPLVYPTDWQEAGPEHWEVELRCPNCEWRGTGVFAQDAVESFDDELDRGIDLLLADYRSLVNSNMEDEIERFARALEADAILPLDF